MLKRFVDLCLSLSLLVVLAPVLLLVALAVVVDSGTPVLFSQRRVGRYGKPFRILKFRTMYPDSEALRRLTTMYDRRITVAGRFLRRYKLDELPQLINVLLGQMSMVGPRPEVEEFVERYPAADREIVLSVKPGITDNASIEFRDEQILLNDVEDPERTYVEKILPRKIALYKDYIANATVKQDIVLLCRTVSALWIKRRPRNML